MIFTLMNLLRNQEVEMDLHFEVRMKLRKDRPERESFLSRLVHVAQERVLECVGNERQPRRVSSRGTPKAIAHSKASPRTFRIESQSRSRMEPRTRAKTAREKVPSSRPKQKRYASRRRGSLGHNDDDASVCSVCTECCSLCAKAESG